MSKATAICLDAGAEYDEVLAQGGVAPTRLETRERLQQVVAILDRAAHEIRDIGFPDEHAAELGQVLDDLDDAIGAARRLIHNEDPSELVDAIERQDAFAGFTDRLYALGFPGSCCNLF